MAKYRDLSGLWKWTLVAEVALQLVLFVLHYGSSVVEPEQGLGTAAQPREAAAALHGIAEAVGNQDGREIPACGGGQHTAAWLALWLCHDVPVFALASHTLSGHRQGAVRGLAMAACRMSALCTKNQFAVPLGSELLFMAVEVEYRKLSEFLMFSPLEELPQDLQCHSGKGRSIWDAALQSIGISVDGNQIAEPSGAARCEVSQLYAFTTPIPNVFFPADGTHGSRAASSPRHTAVQVQPLVSFCCCAGWALHLPELPGLTITAVIFKGG